jgi:hypothetical protein
MVDREKEITIMIAGKGASVEEAKKKDMAAGMKAAGGRIAKRTTMTTGAVAGPKGTGISGT